MADHHYPFREASKKEVTPIGKEKSLLKQGFFKRGIFPNYFMFLFRGQEYYIR